MLCINGEGMGLIPGMRVNKKYKIQNISTTRIR
jgi:hypothetical protein